MSTYLWQIFYEGEWTIVDCPPDNNEVCQGTHKLIISSSATDGSCPYEEVGPWDYCAGEILPGDGCTFYQRDDTAKFTCV